MIKRFKIFVVPTDDGQCETWISWVPDGPYSSERVGIRAARRLAKSYETDDIVLVKEKIAVPVAASTVPTAAREAAAEDPTQAGKKTVSPGEASDGVAVSNLSVS